MEYSGFANSAIIEKFDKHERYLNNDREQSNFRGFSNVDTKLQGILRPTENP